MEKFELTPAQVKYLSRLVDWDTTGNQDDALYLLLRQVVDACGDNAKVMISVENDDE